MKELEENVIKLFGKIPSNNIPPDDFKSHQNVFDTSKFRKLYYVKPMNEVLKVFFFVFLFNFLKFCFTQLELTWAMPPQLLKYRSKPEEYAAWLLGDEGQGSLLSYLRHK